MHSSGVNILLGNGDGTFQAAVPHLTNPAAGGGFQASFVVTGDFNGDGKTDLAAVNANSSTLSVLLGVGDGTFLTPHSVRHPEPGSQTGGGRF